MRGHGPIVVAAAVGTRLGGQGIPARTGPGKIASVAMQRHCARPGCTTQATATLTYDYGAGTVWIDLLSEEAHPMTHDLCTRHADSLSVPRGWLLQDRRAAASPLFSERSTLAG